MLAFMIIFDTLLILGGLYGIIAGFTENKNMNDHIKKHYYGDGDLMKTDYGCREDFSQRFEDDPWSMFRG